MKIVIASGAGKSGKQIVIDAIVEDIESGRPLGDCPPGYYSAKIVKVVHHELGPEDRTLKALRDYQRQAISATAYCEKKKEQQPSKSKAKGPRNRWGIK